MYNAILVRLNVRFKLKGTRPRSGYGVPQKRQLTPKRGNERGNRNNCTQLVAHRKGLINNTSIT